MGRGRYFYGKSRGVGGGGGGNVFLKGGGNVFLKEWGILFEISCGKGLDIF